MIGKEIAILNRLNIPLKIDCPDCQVKIDIEESYDNGMVHCENKVFKALCSVCNRKVAFYTVKE